MLNWTWASPGQLPTFPDAWLPGYFSSHDDWPPPSFHRTHSEKGTKVSMFNRLPEAMT